MKQFISILLLLFVWVSCARQSNESESTPEPVRYEFGLPIDSFVIDTGFVQQGQTIGGILRDLGATPEQIGQVSVMPSSELDVRLFRPDCPYYGFYGTDSTGASQLRYFVYVADIRRAFVLHLSDSVHVEHQIKPLRTDTCYAEVTIESSLWNAMVGNKLPTQLALDLSEIYAWTIDFFGLQQGDSIRVYYEQQYVDSTSLGIGRIFAANFYHGGKWQDAYYFETSTGVHSYFNHEGTSLRKAFLKAPLNYKRISSHFTYARRHPIFKTVRPHTGVDYAAPAGTPVVTIGDGVVIEKGYKGGGGNTVKIRHNSTYTTAYLHLSKYGEGIAVGKHVSQGQVIGYVGSTGNSTGPHLDFRVWKSGTPVDPLKMESPSADPVPTVDRPVFDSIVTTLQPKLR
ncbi:MAG: M23 family metallopeptidase [Paludibacteraceae bacterium]|nr:M23 family metallopeptidase [Paludibacteraceae bacterium]